MKNYDLFFQQGIKYNLCAAFNWNRRRAKLTRYVWQVLVKKFPTIEHHLQKKRVDKMIHILDCRIKNIIDFLQEESKRQKAAIHKAKPEIYKLQCSNSKCKNGYHSKNYFITVNENEFISGELKCKYCNFNMVTRQDAVINSMLFSLGILLPQE